MHEVDIIMMSNYYVVARTWSAGQEIPELLCHDVRVGASSRCQGRRMTDVTFCRRPDYLSIIVGIKS